MSAWAPHLPAGMPFAVDDLVVDRNLPACWAARWAGDENHPVAYDDRSGWVSAGELEERTRVVAGRLAGAGLAPGDRLLLGAAPSVELLVAYVAALRLGLVVVPLNSAYRQREVQHIVADAAPVAAVVETDEHAAWVRTARPEIPVVGPDVGLPRGTADVLDDAATGDTALLLYTSGTTGAPKGVPLTHGNLLASATAVCLAWRWTPDDRVILALPLFHLHGLGVGVNGTLCAGASMVLRPRFAEDDVLESVRRHDGTLFFGVPTMYRRLLDAADVEALGTLRLCVAGSAPLPPALFAAVAEATGQNLLERYGMSETVMNVSNPYDGERRPGSVGFPLPGVGVRFDEASGEIQVQGPNVFSGYWGTEVPDAFTPDGWFRTGDVGRFDEDGYLHIVGRCKDLIISGGYNVYPREIEDVLRTHVAVVDVAVAGLPDAEWGEQVTAFVVGDPADEPALGALAGDALATYKRPKRYVFVDELPRNALGKVLVHELITKVPERPPRRS